MLVCFVLSYKNNYYSPNLSIYFLKSRLQLTPIDDREPEPTMKQKPVSLFCSFIQKQLLLTETFHLISQNSTIAIPTAERWPQ